MDFRRREKGLGRAPEYSEVWHQIDLRLPSVLNREDKSRHLEVGETGLDLTYTGIKVLLLLFVYLARMFIHPLSL